MSLSDFSTWRFFAQPIIWHYVEAGADLGDEVFPYVDVRVWFPGRYLGPGPLVAPDGRTYVLGPDLWGAGPNDSDGMPGLFDLLFEAMNMIRLPSGTIIMGAYTSMDYPFTSAVIVRTTEEAMFNGVEKGVVGYWNAHQAALADGTGAYTTQLLNYDQFYNWNGLDSWQPHLCWTGQNLLVLTDGGDWEFQGLQSHVKLFISTDDGKNLTEHTTWLDAMPLIPQGLQSFEPDVLTRGATPNTADQILHTGVHDVLEIPTTITAVTQVRRVSPSTTYVQNTDYTLVGTTISWAPGGAEPSAGQQYNVTYSYMGRPDWPNQIQSDGAGTVYASISGSPPNVGDTTQIVRSLDHGQTWELRTTWTPSSPWQVYYDENSNMCVLSQDVLLMNVYRNAVGDDSTLIRSTDGGVTWTEVYTHNGYYPTAFLNLGNDVVLATVDSGDEEGDDPLIIRSEDGGVTWTGVFTYNPANENAIYPGGWDPCGRFVQVNQDEIIIGSQQGRIYYSGNRGLTWQATSPRSQQVITYQATIGEPTCSAGDNRHVLFVGGDGFIFTNVPTPTTILETLTNTMILRGRTVYLKDNEYQYTHQMNVEDFGSTDPDLGGAIGGARDLYIQVKIRTVSGQLGPPSVVKLHNPMPDMSGIPLTMTGTTKSVIVDWATYTPLDPDPDFFEIQCGYEEDPEQLTRVYKRAKDQNNVIVPDVPTGQRLYARVVPYDVFGRGVPTLIYSAVAL